MIIGRKEEQKILLSAAQSEYSELIAVYGRRRVGKDRSLSTYQK